MNSIAAFFRGSQFASAKQAGPYLPPANGGSSPLRYKIGLFLLKWLCGINAPLGTINHDGARVVLKKCRIGSVSMAGIFGVSLVRTVSRHWHGMLPVALSSLGLGFTTYLCIIGLRILTSTLLPSVRSAYLIALIIVAFYLVSWTIVTWWSIGAWRSANLNATLLGRTITKLLVGISGVFQLLIALTLALPAITDAILTVLDDPEYRARGVRIVGIGQELELYGGISSSTPTNLERVLNSDRGAVMLRVTSTGGRVGAAQQTADIVKARHLDTFVQDECDSACTIVFLAGTKRWISKGARLGFHNAKFGGVEVPEEMGRELSKAGLSRDFIRRVENTQSKAMWYPSEQELLSAHVITGVVNGDPLKRPEANRVADTISDSAIDRHPIELQIHAGGYAQFGTDPALSLSDLQTKLGAMSARNDCPDVRVFPQWDAQDSDVRSVLQAVLKFGCSRVSLEDR